MYKNAHGHMSRAALGPQSTEKHLKPKRLSEKSQFTYCFDSGWPRHTATAAAQMTSGRVCSSWEGNKTLTGEKENSNW